MASGKEFKAIVSIAGKIDSSLEKSISKAQKSTSGLGKELKIAGAVGAIGVAAIGTAAVAATKGLLDLGQGYKDASNTIRIGTGATGEALADLNNSMKEVYESVPTDLSSASTAIADLNTRLGLTGNNLEEMSKQSLMVSKTLGDDTSGVIEESSQAFKQWNINAEDMSKEMDYIFKVSQSTGIGFTKLMSTMQSSGATLQDLGYSFDESAAMIGALDKAGIDAGVVLGAMKKGLAGVAESGGDVQATMSDYIKKIQEAGSTTDALAIAADIFGSKASVTMVQAIQRGALSADDLTQSLQASSETILGAAEDTYTLKDRWEMLKAKGANLLEPMASKVLEIATNAFPILENAIETVMPMLQSGAESIIPVLEQIASTVLPQISIVMESILPIIQSIIPVLVGILPIVISTMSQIGEVVWGVIEQLLPIVTQIIGQIGGLLNSLAAQFMPFITQVMSYLQPIIDMIISSLVPILSTIIEIVGEVISVVMKVLDAVMPVITQIIGIVANLITELLSQLMPAIQSILDAIMPVIQASGQIISSILPVIINLIQMLMPILKVIANVIGTVLGGAIKIVTGLFKGIISIVNNVIGVFQKVINFLQGFATTWKTIWTNVSGAVKAAFTGLVGIVKAPINTIIGMVNSVISKINGAGFTIPDWVPVVGGKSFKVGISTLPMLATGGPTKGPSIAGEAGPEMVISYDPKYRKQNIGYWQQAGQILGVETMSAKAGRMMAEDDGYASVLETRTTINNSGYSIESIQFNPTIIIQGNADKNDVSEAIEESKEDFFDKLDEWWDNKTGGGDYEPEFG